MAAKQIVLHEVARDALREGVDVLAQAVRTTLGPRGRNVALGRTWGSPIISPDGVTVANEIALKDPFANMGAQLLKQAASKTSDVAGDGTTTATLLAAALVDGGLKLVAAGASPLLLKRGLDQALPALVAEIKRQAMPIAGRTEIAQIATISAQDPNIGELLATIMDKLGRDAVIAIEEGPGTTLKYELVEGMQLDRSSISPYFVTDPIKMLVELEEPYILITDTKISAAVELVPLLEALLQTGAKDLLLIAEDVDGDALATLVLNHLRGTLNPLAIKAPGFGDQRKALLQDIAVLTGGQVLSAEFGRTLETAQLGELGRARRVRADKDSSIIVEGRGNDAAIRARINQIKAQITMATSDFEREQLEERAAKLAGGVAVIKVGAATETAMRERKARVDDALHATRAAIEEGIVAGGGVAYLNLVSALEAIKTEFDEERMAINLLRTILEEPAQQIAENSGLHGWVVVDQIKQRQQAENNPNIGFDALRGEYGDLVRWGVIDPAKVVRSALENAISVAGMILSTDVLIAEEPETEPHSEAS